MTSDAQARGRTVLVTGVGRREGIGFAITRRLLQVERARVFAQSCDAYDVSEPWGVGTPGAVQGLAELSSAPSRLGNLDIDLSDVEAPAVLFDAVESRFGAVDSLVINHARSQLGELGSLTAENLDLTWAVNVRASLLLVQEFAQRYVDHPAGGRVVLFTSGQGEGPMPTEIPYAVTKGAIGRDHTDRGRFPDRTWHHRQHDQSWSDRYRLGKCGSERVRLAPHAARSVELTRRGRSGSGDVALARFGLDHRTGHRGRRRIPTLHAVITARHLGQSFFLFRNNFQGTKADSSWTDRLIFDSPSLRSSNVIGTSARVSPCLTVR
ncbi:hypothetical protein J2W18_001679 [Rhodococcus cercidiphylli]|nr:hypothetical protein [Rhodococcus cercidiphylli]